MNATAALTAALTLATSDYQREVLAGTARLSGSDIKGAARQFAGGYAATRKALLARVTAAGIPYTIETGKRGLRSIVWGA